MAAPTRNSSGNFSSSPPSPSESRVRSSSNHFCRAKLDGMAMRIINGVSGAFFASLDRCSCVRIATEEDGDEPNGLPLIFNDGNPQREDEGRCIPIRTRKRKKNGLLAQ